jgi:Tol biopolymer transport system component
MPRGAIGILLAAAISLAAAPSAHATFPGANGEIAHTRGDYAAYHAAADLYVASPNGANQRMIADAVPGYWIGSPSYSADGSRLAWDSNHRLGFSSVYVADADGRGAQQLGPAKNPALAPAGDRIAYDHELDTVDHPPGLYISDIDGSNRIRVGAFWDPDWSPDGTTIVASDAGWSDTDDGDLFAVPLSAGPPRRLTDTPETEHAPSWAPDGTAIVYAVRGENGHSDIWVIGADGSNPRRIAEGYDPVWSPDGTKILYHGGVGEYHTSGLWLVDPDGANARLLMPAAYSPAWQPATERAPIHRPNHSPKCSSVEVSPRVLPAPTNGRFRRVRLSGASDPDGDPIKLEAAWVGQDEPVRDRNGRRPPDAHWTTDPSVVLLRKQRARRGDGRVYTIDFWATDGFGARCGGSVKVAVPRHRGRPAIESPFYASSIRLAGESKREAKQRRNRLHARG